MERMIGARIEEAAMAQASAGSFYSVAQAARYLGVSRSTVWRWIEGDRLPAYRVGPRNIRIRRQDLDRVVRPAEPKRKQGSGPIERFRIKEPSREELARRRQLVAETLAIREQLDIRPLRTTDLIRQVREGAWHADGDPAKAG
jgi:excisionase family DNA binding protein